jgi:hypothetical protein
MQFPDNKVMDQVDFANSPLQQQAIGFSEVISKVNDFFRLNCFSVPFAVSLYIYICPVIKYLLYQITSYSRALTVSGCMHGKWRVPSESIAADQSDSSPLPTPRAS